MNKLRFDIPIFRLAVRAASLLSVAAALAGNLAYGGRGDKSGTAAAPELLIPVGARSIGIGGASLATAAGVEALYWNPAGLARAEGGTVVMFSHMSYLAEIGVEYGALSTRLGSIGYVGLAVKSLSVGEIPITTEDQPDGTGGTASPTFLVIGGTFSRQLSDRIFVGVTSNVVYEKMDRVSATGVAFTRDPGSGDAPEHASVRFEFEAAGGRGYADRWTCKDRQDCNRHHGKEKCGGG